MDALNVKAKFAIRVPVTGPLATAENILRIGVRADELGFDAVTTHDHVSQGYDERYHNSGGVSELVDENEKKGIPLSVFETIATLSVLAGKTKNVRLVPSAVVLPWRHPVLFAKQAISLHELSGCRFVCFVVVGRWKTDFEVMNVKRNFRGRIMDEYLEILYQILRGKTEDGFEGKYLKLPKSSFYPKPSKKLPIWIGGSFHDKVFERLVKYGDGFTPGTMPADAFDEGIPRMRKYLTSHGRNPDDLEIGAQTFLCLMKDKEEAQRLSHYTIESFFHGPEFSGPDASDPSRSVRDVLMSRVSQSALVGSVDDVIEKVDDYVKAGVGFFDVRQVHRSVDDILKMMKLFASEVMPSFS